MSSPLNTVLPPRAPPIQYHAPLGTRWEKEKAAAGGSAAFDLPTDPVNIGPWILGECIGKGASGRVKIARHCHTGQLAAVKILPISPLASSRNSAHIDPVKAEKQRLGIDREVTMMKLMNHPNIMRIYDVYEGDRELFLVLEYIQGGELFDFLVNRGRLPPAEALVYFKQIIYGLNYAHTFSIIHRDLKPENILIASLSPPLIKIADWGMAAFAPPHLQLETSCGSPHYASPEIVNGEKYSGNATDIWSCGVILFALLTGRLPFDDKNVRTLLGKVKVGKYEIPPWVDPLARDLIQRMLVVDVSKRITIPDILSHPWLRLAESSTTLLSSSPTVRQNPCLPPSPSTLAKPVSLDSMDPELFASLRIIWGRHTDASGEAIKRDLSSPQGQGVHAKTFYFLLMQYREETRRSRAATLSWREPLRSQGPPALDSMKFDQDWKLIDIPNDTDNMMHVDSPPHPKENGLPTIDGRPRPPSLRLTSPRVSRVSSERRDRPPSPAGPRAPPFLGRARSVFPSDNPSEIPRPYAGYTVVRRKTSPSTSPSTESGTTTSSVGPRPNAPKRGCTYHGINGRQDGRLDFQILARRQSGAPARSDATAVVRRSSSSHGRNVSSVIQLDASLLPPLKSGEGDAIAVTSIALAAPDAPSSLRADGDGKITLPSEEPVIYRLPRAQRRPTSRAIMEDKENIVDKDRAPERMTIGLGVGRGIVGKEMGNVIKIGEVPEHKKKVKEPRARSQTVDHCPLKHKRSTIGGLSSPIALSSQSANKPMTPVVGEFKGWISNLFGRTSNYGCLYSPLDVRGAYRIIESVLRERNVTLDVLYLDEHIVLKCGLDQTPLDRHASIALKPVRFKIELLPVSPKALSSSASVDSFAPRPLASPFHMQGFGQPQSPPAFEVSSSRSSHPTSAPVSHGRSLLPMDIPSGSFSIVVMAKDKGSSTSFNSLWQDIKENLGNTAVNDPSCKSPLMPNTPLVDRQSFMVL
ncbi:hypothetical protein DL96DRAFT_1696038 [Flagelloscypha sp. PMI_526]|nr:hypothetical protein DL96DRAFT_1696038 [Flagelloscypha sp. PMI_526]